MDDKINIARHLLAEQACSQECGITIKAGAGSAESSAWMTMLKLMYIRWAEKHNFEETGRSDTLMDGELKEASIKFRGKLVFSWLRGEIGVHRLVHISPHNEQNRRHTSFASVSVRRIYEGHIIDPYERRDFTVAIPDSGSGHQIRSYILHPYEMVKDLRTNYETDNVKAVLAGEIDDFLAAYVLNQITQPA